MELGQGVMYFDFQTFSYPSHAICVYMFGVCRSDWLKLFVYRRLTTNHNFSAVWGAGRADATQPAMSPLNALSGTDSKMRIMHTECFTRIKDK